MRKKICISLQEFELKALDELSEFKNLTRSGLIREWIFEAYGKKE